MAGEPILIIEDNQLNLMLEKTLLTLKGYEVQTAGDAEEALSLLATFQPELIIMDLQLPNIDGLELTRQLKNDPRYQAIIIIAVTAYAMRGDKEKAFHAGCSGYISKPIDVKTFADTIGDFIKRK